MILCYYHTLSALFELWGAEVGPGITWRPFLETALFSSKHWCISIIYLLNCVQLTIIFKLLWGCTQVIWGIYLPILSLGKGEGGQSAPLNRIKFECFKNIRYNDYNMKFRACGELLKGKSSLLLYGSETWCLREEMALLRRTERALIRVMHVVRLMDRRRLMGGFRGSLRRF